MPSNLRLTLRTLLSYLDDTLDPGQAKLIGQKVAESEQARELMDRIRQVTRRRRLTTPPAAGPGGIDANTIAEYLDNDVTAEQAEEVERICLASDVHLAEVAACHQILTLVLGEPALVPPSSRQRMYGLVKGPEAIPFRKPPRASKQADLDLSTSDASLEVDDSMRIPALMRTSSMRNTILLGGGGIVAACLLVFALWQLFHTPATTNDDHPANQGQVAANNNTKPPTDPVKNDATPPAKKDSEPKKAPEEKQPVEPKTTPKEKLPVEPKTTPNDKKGPATTPQLIEIKTGQEDIPVAPPELKPAVLGQYVPNLKSPETLLQKQGDGKGNWVRLWGKDLDVTSARPLLSLPGNRSAVQLKTGLNLTLWGTMPEIWPNPYLFESMVELYAHPVLALDMTLRRGRVEIRNTRTDGKPAMVRIRFDNPLKKAEETFTLGLIDKDATAVVERVAYFPLEEPFYEDAKNPNRLGPTVFVAIFLLDGTGYLRWSGNLDLVDARTRPQFILWNSAQGTTRGPQAVDMPDWALPTPKEGNAKMRTQAVQAVELLAKNFRGKQLDVALREALDNTDAPATQRLALLCYSALDDFSVPLEILDNEESKPDLRRTAVYTLRHWMAQNPVNEYQLYDRLTVNYKNVVARKLMELLHGISQKDAGNPATWQLLIDDLNNTILPLRELSAWNLEMLVPAGQKIAMQYAANAPEPQRVAVQRQWRMLIPPGQLPPMPQAPGPMKK